MSVGDGAPTYGEHEYGARFGVGRRTVADGIFLTDHAVTPIYVGDGAPTYGIHARHAQFCVHAYGARFDVGRRAVADGFLSNTSRHSNSRLPTSGAVLIPQSDSYTPRRTQP